jgi:hypothetical protein
MNLVGDYGSKYNPISIVGSNTKYIVKRYNKNERGEMRNMATKHQI